MTIPFARKVAFLAAMSVVALAAVVQALQAAEVATATRASSPADLEAGYVRPQPPRFDIPPYRGERYQDSVPDTLDLAEMAGLAINGLTGPADPAADYEIYATVDFFRNPPVMMHDFSDPIQPKFMAPLVLMRIISGSEANLDSERGQINYFLKTTGPDGLWYRPLKGRPWWRTNEWDEVKDRSGGKQEPPPYAGGAFCGPSARLLEAYWLYYGRDKNPMWKDLADRMVENGAKCVDRMYSPPAGSKGFLAEDGWTVQGLARHYRQSGSATAKASAVKLINYLKIDAAIFDKDGKFLFEPEFQPGRGGPHFHCHANCVVGFLEYAIAAQDRELMEYVDKSYRWARLQGSPLVGFFYENVRRDYPGSETCAVADMLQLAVMLSKSGKGDYWDDADRWVRNYFAELQMTPAQGERLKRMAATMPAKPVAYNEMADRMIDRNIGSFTSFPSGNEWAVHLGIVHCCTGNGARGLYCVWDNILNYQDGRLRVNLLLNRASPWADVYSSIPYEGRVTIKTKKLCQEVLIRVPEWIPSGSREVRCEVDGKPATIAWRGRYVCLGAVAAKAAVNLMFPIAEKTVTERIGGVDYRLVIKGNTVVSIDPPGKHCPLYVDRAKYRQDKTIWREVSRFVSSEKVDW